MSSRAIFSASISGPLVRRHEDILAWHSWGFRDRLRPGQTWGRRYWLEILPRICAELDPSRPYWPESPWSGSLELDPNDSNRGDRHIWDATAKVEGLRSITPRFASEFGHQSPPALRSLAKALDIDEDTLASMTAADGCTLITDLQRATGGDTPQYGEFLTSRFDPAKDFASWIVQAQIVQAKAMRIAYSWYRTNRPQCSGALVWQMNDAWRRPRRRSVLRVMEPQLDSHQYTFSYGVHSVPFE
jgi:beta-mannosidase